MPCPPLMMLFTTVVLASLSRPECPTRVSLRSVAPMPSDTAAPRLVACAQQMLSVSTTRLPDTSHAS